MDSCLPKTTLSLIIPCYNEEKSLADCVQLCLKINGASIPGVPQSEVQVELLIVDDCSTDASYAVACSLAEQHPEVRVVRHEKNMGKGAALRTGFAAASGDHVGIQDADLEYNPQDYLELLAPLVEGKADVVYGSRYLRQETRRVLYFWHTWMNRSLTFISNMFTNLDITDMETCYKLFRRDVVQALAPSLQENRFGFEPEMTCLIAQGGYRVYECAISYSPRTYDEGKKIGWKDGLWALYCILHYGAHAAPLPMQILLYFFIGGVCAVANLLAFALLLKLSVSLHMAIIGAFALAAALNYGLCVAILFRHRARWSTGGEALAYVLSVMFMGLVDYLLTLGLVRIGISPIWSKVWATLVGFAGNFIARKYLVFQEKK